MARSAGGGHARPSEHLAIHEIAETAMCNFIVMQYIEG